MNKKIKNNKVKSKRAWLVTWDWDGEHAEVKDPFIALINFRRSSNFVKNIITLYFDSSQLAFFEQLKFMRNSSNKPFKIQSIENEIKVRGGNKVINVPTSSMIYGENPRVYARLVQNIEAYLDENNHEHLEWDEPMQTDWERRHLIRNS